MILKLYGIRLLVTDFKKSVAFYRDVLEIPLEWYVEEAEYANFNTGEAKIEIMTRKTMADALGEGYEQVAAKIPTSVVLDFGAEDIDARYESLRQKGVSFLKEPHNREDWGARVAHLRDPDGNTIELYQLL